MADGGLSRLGPGVRPARLWRRLPTAARIAAVYLAARVVTTGFLLGASALSTPMSRFGPDPSLADFVRGWDAQWYWLIAVSGYPAELPLTDAGHVAENAWAFMPLYAYLALIVGLGNWGIGAFVVSFTAGYFACLALYRLLRERQDAVSAMWAVAFFASAPLAALFQVGYAESLFLLLLLLALLCVERRRWPWLYLLVPLMGFARPGVLAFALFLGLYAIVRWVRRRVDRLSVREATHIVATGLLAAAVGFCWQVIVGVVTGDGGAYLDTEMAWRRSWVPNSDAFVPFEGWIRAAEVWFPIWGLDVTIGYVALAVLVAALAALLLFEPHVRRLGVSARLWGASYLVYLLAVFFPQSSVFRLLVPLSPLWGAVALPRSLGYRVTVLGLCLAGQWWWIFNMYALGNTFWQIP